MSSSQQPQMSSWVCTTDMYIKMDDTTPLRAVVQEWRQKYLGRRRRHLALHLEVHKYRGRDDARYSVSVL